MGMRSYVPLQPAALYDRSDKIIYHTTKIILYCIFYSTSNDNCFK